MSRTQCHNEVRDVIGDLASLAYKEVVKEPIVQEANDAEGVPSLIADLSIRGVWQPQTVALFDVRVTDTDAPSHSQRVVTAILSSAEEEKKKKYSEAAALRRTSFTPLVVSVNWSWVEKQIFLSNNLLRNLAISGKNPTVKNSVGWMRARLSFDNEANLCLRDSRTKWRSELVRTMKQGCPLSLPECHA